MFPVRRFLLSHLHNLAFKSLVPIAAALPFTFIRWRHTKGQIWPALSHKEVAWIPFGVNDSGPNWAHPTRRWVGRIARVLREEERGREDD